MSFIVEPRVSEITTTSGAGALTLAGAPVNYQPFSARCANGDTVPYIIVHQTAAEWEEGIGTWGTGGILTRTTVTRSSNADAAVTFSAGSKDVFISVPAAGVLEGSGGLVFKQKSAGQRLLIDGSAISILAADFTGGNVNTVQPFFPAGQGAFTLEAGTAYLIEGHISTVRAAGTTSHTTSVSFGGTATFTMARYSCACRYGARAAATPVRPYTSDYKGTAPAAAQVVSLASTIAQSKVFDFDGMFVVNAAGTLIPQFQYSAAPGGAPTIELGSYFRITPVGPAATTIIGAWG